MPRLSVIVPVYKVEKYIHTCVDSILNQTFTDFELILVDDGSPDNCGKICDEYAKKDRRVKVIHKKNGGQSSARNKGLDHAKGNYISFIDSDDDILPEMFEKMMSFIEVQRLDIAFCDVILVRGKRIRTGNMYSQNKVFDNQEALIDLLKGKIDNAVWNKIYKKNVFDKVRFVEGIVYEDVRIMHSLFNEANRIGYVNGSFYRYYKREHSTIAQSFNSKSRYDCFIGYRDRLIFAEQHGLPCIEDCRRIAISTALSLLTVLYATNENKCNNKTKDAKDFIIKNNNQEINKMRIKDKVLLWSFKYCPLLHILYAHMSYLTRNVR